MASIPPLPILEGEMRGLLPSASVDERASEPEREHAPEPGQDDEYEQAQEQEEDGSSPVSEERLGNAGLPPELPRRSSEPLRSPPPLLLLKPTSLPLRPRARSPLARTHLRSRSTASALAPPAMTRSHSMPVPDSSSRGLLTNIRRPVSPSNSSVRYRSPSRKSAEECSSNLGLPSLPDIGENGPLDMEVDTTPRASDSTPLSHLGVGSSHTFPRRYRPSSPFRSVPQQASPLVARPKTPTSASSSPLIPPAKFNESYPTSTGYALSYSSTSSMPSTPTSARSRSPSISSLETIPDSPGAEEAALEAENLARLRAAAEEADESREGRRSGLEEKGKGFGFGKDKRKRWSVCGAERRGDLDLETIWED